MGIYPEKALTWLYRLLSLKGSNSPSNTKAKPANAIRHSLIFDTPNPLSYNFVPLPDHIPFFMLEVYRYLRDSIPDLSDAVWTWKRLCNNGFDLQWGNEVTEAKLVQAKRIIEQLNQRINSGDGGLTNLLDIIYTSLFTYGASALEIVFSPSSNYIQDIVPIDVWTIRFRWEDHSWQAYQIYGNETIHLPSERFVYIALDRDGTNPYGRSLFRALPFVIKVQQRLMEDMARAMHNAGWARLHVQYKPEAKLPEESEEEYQNRMEANLAEIREQMSNLGVDQNVVTYDNVGISVVQGAQRYPAYYDTQRAIEEQIITGTHMMPILLGRNYGTTETYGTVQYEIINRQVETINRSIARILERIYRLELALAGVQVKLTVQPRSNCTSDAQKQSLVETRRVNELLQLLQAGIISIEEVRNQLRHMNILSS